MFIPDPNFFQSWIPDPNFFRPVPGSASKNLNILTQKKWFQALPNMIRAVHPGSGSWFLTHPGSGSRGQKGTGSRIRLCNIASDTDAWTKINKKNFLTSTHEHCRLACRVWCPGEAGQPGPAPPALPPPPATGPAARAGDEPPWLPAHTHRPVRLRTVGYKLFPDFRFQVKCWFFVIFHLSISATIICSLFYYF